MLSNYAALVCWISLLLLLLGSSALLRGRRWRLPHPGLRLIVILLTLSLPGFALERRNGGLVAVGVNETVDDTLLATGDTVRVDGVVNGDVLAFGRAVEVSGTVKGDLLSWAQRVTVTGTVEGRIYSFAQTFDLTGQVDHSLYGAAQTLELDSRGRVGEGILAAASDASIDGRVQRGVWLGAGGAEVSGDIGRELAVAGGTLTLASTARVGGDLWARVRQLKDVHIAEGATIAGKRDIQQTAELTVRQSRYRSFGFYLWQALWVAAAMLVGWLALALFPGFVRGSTQAVASGWRSLGLGLGVLAGVPLAILVIAITVVGIPISLIGLAVYLVALYLAKIWVAAFLGRLILKPAEPGNRDWLLGLLLGLLILTAGGFIPFLGGLVRFVVLCLGLGAFAWQVYRTIKQPAVA
jgi:cytoskeletal protein CcmA (bactofilin family)